LLGALLDGHPHHGRERLALLVATVPGVVEVVVVRQHAQRAQLVAFLPLGAVLLNLLSLELPFA